MGVNWEWCKLKIFSNVVQEKTFLFFGDASHPWWMNDMRLHVHQKSAAFWMSSSPQGTKAIKLIIFTSLEPKNCWLRRLRLKTQNFTLSAASPACSLHYRSPLSIMCLITLPVLFTWIVSVSQRVTLLALFLRLQGSIAGSEYLMLC